MITRAVALLALTFVGFGFQTTVGHTASSGPAENSTMVAASARLGHESVTTVLQWLRRQPVVARASRSAEGSALDLTFRSGVRGLIAIHHATLASQGKYRSVFDAMLRGRTHDSTARALVLEPYATQLGLGSSAGDPEVNQLKAAGYRVDTLYDTQVTVASMTTINQYNVVYMHTHSDPFGAGDGVVATGQLANDDSSVAEQLRDGSVVRVNVSGSHDVYYGITSAFIRQYVGHFPSDSLVFLNGCGLIKAPTFWFALQSKGVSVMVSWDAEATSQDNYLGAAAFFAEMGQGLSVSAAIAAEQAAGYGKSSPQGQQATLGYLGDGSITLKAAANPAPAATSTPVPTARASTPVPTATPTRPAPTATSTTVPPTLTLRLLPKVLPGHRQVLHITSSPDTIIHVHVAFPNGDSRSDTTATDASGGAVLSYLQHESKIAFGHRIAMVTVDAIKGGATTTRTIEYRIGLARLDVSVVPRDQSVGKRVTVWVHTRAHHLASVVLHFPNGTTKKLRGRTGSLGWMHLQYVVPAAVTVAQNRVTVVVAKVKLHSAYQTRTTFTIR